MAQFIDISWTDLKARSTSKDLEIQYKEQSGYYLVWIQENVNVYRSKILIEVPANADQTDFEDNYQSGANQTHSDKVEIFDNDTGFTADVIDDAGTKRLAVDASFTASSVAINDGVNAGDLVTVKDKDIAPATGDNAMLVQEVNLDPDGYIRNSSHPYAWDYDDATPQWKKVGFDDDCKAIKVKLCDTNFINFDLQEEGVSVRENPTFLNFIGSSATVTTSGNGVDITFTDIGENNTSSNVGTGLGLIAKPKVGTDLPFKSIKGGTNVTITNNADDITISSIDTGEANTSSNVGSGSGLALAKVGTDLPFKSIIGGANITVTPNANDITISAAADTDTHAETQDEGVQVQADTSFINFKGDTVVATANGAGTDVTVDSYSTTATDIGSTSTSGTSDDIARGDHTHKGVFTVKKSGDSDIHGSITLSEGTNITLTQTGNDIVIDANDTDTGITQLTGDVTAGPGSGSQVATIADNSVTNAKLDDMPTDTIKGRNDVGTGDPEDLTPTEVTAMLDVFTPTLNGLAPLSGGGTSNFLRADGTWTSPSGSGEVNTASNVGTAGVGPFKQKTGVDLEFKNINAGSNKVTITDDTGNDEIDIDIDESNLTLSNIGGSVTDAQVPNTITLDNITQITSRSHTDLTDIGTNTHAQIDTHISSTLNPHSVTIDQVTPTTIKGDLLVENGSNVVRLPVGTDTQVLTADSAEATGVKWTTLVDDGENNTASNVGAGNGVFKQKTGVDLEFKSLVAGTNITLTPGTDDITISSTDTGEANTASNVGTAGTGVFKQKTGVDLEFKNINAGSNKISIVDDVANNEIDIDVNENNLTLTASQISDFDTEVSNNASVTANTAKVSNATHTGEVTGSTVLTVDKTAISNQTAVTAATDDYVLIGDTSDSDNLKKVTVQSIADLGSSGADTIHIDIGGNNISKNVDRNVTNLVVKEFIYRGAEETVTNVKALFSNDDLASATLEIYDFTNSQVIASHTATNGVYEIKDLGTISNLPTTDAIFQIRLSTGTGSNQDTAHFTAVRMAF